MDGLWSDVQNLGRSFAGGRFSHNMYPSLETGYSIQIVGAGLPTLCIGLTVTGLLMMAQLLLAKVGRCDVQITGIW